MRRIRVRAMGQGRGPHAAMPLAWRRHMVRSGSARVRHGQECEGAAMAVLAAKSDTGS